MLLMVPLLASYCTAYDSEPPPGSVRHEKKKTLAKFSLFTELYELFKFLSEAVSGAACSLAIYTLERGLV